MADSRELHPTAGRRRRDKGPPSMLSTAQGALPRLEGVNDTEGEHSDDSAGEKEAKRQRSEPTAPVSTSSRLPYEYDAFMGITRVGTKEAEGFEEEIDTAEYHDATDEPVKREETEGPQELRSMGFQGGYGSSSLKECIELLNATSNHAPAPLDSGVGQIYTDPHQVLPLAASARLHRALVLVKSLQDADIYSHVQVTKMSEPQLSATHNLLYIYIYVYML